VIGASTVAGLRRSVLAAGVLALAVGLVAGCGGSTDKVEAVTLQARIDLVEAEVKTRIGPASCTSDGECRVLPMGALACGGASKFLAYSIRGTDEAALAALAADHRTLSAQKLAEQSAVGPCVALSVPAAYCDLTAPLSCKTR
jgi:hypothetical protein